MFTRNSCSLRPLCFLSFRSSCLFPLSALPPASPPARMSNTCYLTACGSVGLGEAQKASLAWPAAALAAYLSQPLPQHSTFAPRTLHYPQERFSFFFIFSLSPKAHINIWSVSLGHSYFVSFLLFVFRQCFLPAVHSRLKRSIYGSYLKCLWQYLQSAPKPFRVIPRQCNRCSSIEAPLCCEIRRSIHECSPEVVASALAKQIKMFSLATTRYVGLWECRYIFIFFSFRIIVFHFSLFEGPVHGLGSVTLLCGKGSGQDFRRFSNSIVNIFMTKKWRIGADERAPWTRNCLY